MGLFFFMREIASFGVMPFFIRCAAVSVAALP